MTYMVKEIFRTLQGEGIHTGRAAVFCRFTGCNLWSGREQDRAAAVCKFCDTEFIGGRGYACVELADAIESVGDGCEFVVFTGGEPVLQLDANLIDAVHRRGLRVHVETNGTLISPSGVDWLCVSPKQGAQLMQVYADEVKLVYPQIGHDPEVVKMRVAADHYALQPMDGPKRKSNTEAAIAYIMDHPWWRLSLQMHKIIGLP
jgi:7-carboxy-7-deazaguanine synthase (Cx14CxxC type)